MQQKSLSFWKKYHPQRPIVDTMVMVHCIRRFHVLSSVALELTFKTCNKLGAIVEIFLRVFIRTALSQRTTAFHFDQSSLNILKICIRFHHKFDVSFCCFPIAAAEQINTEPRPRYLINFDSCLSIGNYYIIKLVEFLFSTIFPPNSYGRISDSEKLKIIRITSNSCYTFPGII